ncbi:hypothetical protein ACFYW6_36810 [Streptomyces sp. NPDC002659]
MDLSKSELAAQAKPVGTEARGETAVAEITVPASIVRIEDVEDEW